MGEYSRRYIYNRFFLPPIVLELKVVVTESPRSLEEQVRQYRNLCRSHRHHCKVTDEIHVLCESRLEDLQHRLPSVIDASVSVSKACHPPCKNHGATGFGILDVGHHRLMVDLAQNLVERLRAYFRII